MNTLTQKLRFSQSVVLYSFRNSIQSTIRKFGVSPTTIYRWRKKHDGTLQALTGKSRRPHSHPNQHTPEELKLISDIVANIRINKYDCIFKLGFFDVCFVCAARVILKIIKTF